MRRIRQLATAFALTLLGAGVVAASPGVAWADTPDQFTINGDEVSEPVVLRADEQPRVAAALHNEVNWLSGRSGDADEPEDDILGPAYLLEVHVDGEARQRFTLYPLAEGGPRVHRPAEQPGDRTTDEGWFYGRLSMPDTLAAAGAPVPGAQPVLPGGGIGGGNGPEDPAAPLADTSGIMHMWRDSMLLTAVTGAGIVAGLAAVALLIRRKV